MCSFFFKSFVKHISIIEHYTWVVTLDYVRGTHEFMCVVFDCYKVIFKKATKNCSFKFTNKK